MSRSVLKSFYCNEVSEGVGAKVRRSIGSMQMRNFKPFLLLDHFNVDPSAGFPDHPHRGQETITYMTKGQFAHQDFTSDKVGILNAGDCQIMRAGRGIMHAEMPVQGKSGENIVGMQLWVDLPKHLKHSEPDYRDLRASEIPTVTPNDKVTVKIISGKAYGVENFQDLAYSPVDYYYYTVQPGGSFEQSVSEDYNSFIYLLDGSLEINNKRYDKYNALFFELDGNKITGSVPKDATSPAEFVLVAGQILDQPIVQHGPFVETSKDLIYKAFMDYQSASNGFERGKNWRSKIADGVKEDDLAGLK
ncbi:BA75_00929T0 [Komagataella pastoris]|uniref:BA75_00929T0 n=1 Tax=Komagataella pastoris TaxID=4922 RepID=A0A1B2J672_PICPA|nr:BA75_00929T0 [Komagataella pastoris]